MKTNELENIITYHMNKYPLMEVSDVIKLIYQNEFGGEHLVKDTGNAAASIMNETKTIELEIGEELMEYIGDGICRIYINGFVSIFSSSELAVKILAAMFVESSVIKKGSLNSYADKLDLLLNMIKSDAFADLISLEIPPLWAFDYSATAEAIAAHKSGGYSVPSHSSAYRNAYSPAYRIVLSEFYRYTNLFEAIETLAAEKPLIVIGIDGKCGSGKTTLGRIIETAFNCQVISMDDFFLPEELRTESRYQEPGGNVHYERFIQEIVNPLNSKEVEFSYRAFNCKNMEYAESRKSIKSSGIILVEGSYSMRPEFRDIYDLKVFLDVRPDEQKRRILSRNGQTVYTMFESKWIPLENNYFESLDISKACDFVYEG